MRRDTAARLGATALALALAAGGLTVSGLPASAFGIGPTNRACTEGRCTTTSVVSSANPSVVNQAVTYTATVKPPLRSSGTPIGTVAFTDGGVPITGCAAVPLSSAGFATCTRVYTSPGTHSISARYSGDKRFHPSSGSLPTQTVFSGRPRARIKVPSSRRIYYVGQRVPTRFSCTDAPGAPGVSRCVDSRGSSAPGGLLDTSRAGRHTYTVTATSRDTLVGRTSVRYRVEPSNFFVIRHMKSGPHGVVTFDIVLPGPGQVDVFESAWKDGAFAATVRLEPALHRFTFARLHLNSPKAGTYHVAVAPNRAGLALLKRHSSTHIRLWVTFQPTGGSPRTAAYKRVFVSR